MYCDAVSSLTHLCTAIWAVFATLVLLRLTRGHGIGRIAVGIYGVTMVQLYLASGVFHGLLYLHHSGTWEDRKRVVESLWVFQRLDKSAIFLLIGGSFVPIYVYLLRGWWRIIGLASITVIALLGISMIWVFPSLGHRWLVSIYVAMGLSGLILSPIYLRRISWNGMIWVGALVVAYLGGAMIEVMKWPNPLPGVLGYHELLHLADMLGTITHFTLILKYVIVRKPLRAADVEQSDLFDLTFHPDQLIRPNRKFSG